MEAREHFELAAKALAEAEAPGVAPEVRAQRLESMRNHTTLAHLANQLVWKLALGLTTTNVPATDAAAPSTAPVEQSAHQGPWAWWVSNRRDLLMVLGEIAERMVWLFIGLITVPALHYAAGGHYR